MGLRTKTSKCESFDLFNMKIVIFIFFILTSFQINAACRSSKVCDGYGNCSIQDVCDSTLDLPSMDIAPLSLPSMDLKPMPSLDLPPLGTTDCQYMQVNGIWQNVCN